MADDVSLSNFAGGSFAALLARYIGETVTIFTASGGQSGAGFTGVVLSVNECFVRLITRIGPPPGCSLGNACTGFNVGNGYGNGYYPNMHGNYDMVGPGSAVGAITAGGWDGWPVYTVGSIADIPIDTIVSFVHSAV